MEHEPLHSYSEDTLVIQSDIDWLGLTLIQIQRADWNLAELVTESDGSDENLKLEGLTVVVKLVLETLMIPMMIHKIILYWKEATVINLVCVQTALVLGGRY